MVLSLLLSLVGGILGFQEGEPFMNEDGRDLSASALALTQAGARWSHLLTLSHLGCPEGCPGSTIRYSNPLVSLLHNFPLGKAASVQTTTHAPGYLEKTASSEFCSQVWTNKGMRVLGQGPSRTEFFLLGS